ncbi:MAG: hypothetical protein A4S09_01890 [Proteobacteria bacterium SG_bin7]|nr:MAG: hypothetical protein A4S09_01890 [Proteobacteria bacterium SG_bin7]
MAEHQGIEIEKGVAYLYFAYDVGFSIDLNLAQKKIAQITERARIRQNKRSPWYFEFEPAPLKINHSFPELEIGGFKTLPEAEATIFDFGAISISIKMPYNGNLETLVDMSYALYEDEQIERQCRYLVENLTNVIKDAINKLEISEHFEEYKIFQIVKYESTAELTDMVKKYGKTLARILRSENQELSEDETRDATWSYISYAPNDLLLIDWNTAILIDETSDDVRAVLEFVNVELLELSYLDLNLDNSLDRAYEVVSRLAKKRIQFPGHVTNELRRIGRLQVESAFLFEGINNALKLLGDQYLARVYRLASTRFHLPEWDTTILRKISALESIYEKINDQASIFRAEILEWIIILLILVSLFLPHR